MFSARRLWWEALLVVLALLGASADAAVQECGGCGDVSAGQRVAPAAGGSKYYDAPCILYPAGTMPKCTVFSITGWRTGSTCGDNNCWAEITVNGESKFMLDHPCSNLAMPTNNPTCDASAACGECSAITPGPGVVSSLSGAKYYRAPCNSAVNLVGTLAMCKPLNFTGFRSASNCGDGTCYTEVQINGSFYYVADRACGETTSVLSTSDYFACAPPQACGSCANAAAGYKVVTGASGAQYFNYPCSKDRPAGSVYQCQNFYFTGKRSGSTCSENKCYAQIKVNNTLYWMAERDCGSSTPSFGTTCTAGCDSCASAAGGERVVSVDGNLKYYSAACSTGSVAGTMAQGALFNITGTRTATTCKDGMCYIQFKVGTLARYAVEHPCGVGSPTTVGLPVDCPGDCSSPPGGDCYIGTCNRATGSCSYSPKDIGTPCSGGFCDGAGTCKAAAWWTPPAGIQWQYQLSDNGTIIIIPGVKLYIIDLETAATEMTRLRNAVSDVRIVCYFSAGSYEHARATADATRGITAANWTGVLGSVMGDWPDEKWLDIRSPKVKSIMRKRMEYAKQIGCDGVDPDNMDGYNNSPGFPLTWQNQKDYNLWIANTAHSLGLAVGLKNCAGTGLVAALKDSYDWFVVESCFTFEECGDFENVDGKNVFGLQYCDAGPVFSDPGYKTADPSCYCPRAIAKGYSFLMKKVELGWERISCSAYCTKYAPACAAGTGNAACDSAVANVCSKLS